MYHPKTESNVGTLWRSAMTYQASLIATVGPRRYEHQASDTTKAPLRIPLIKFEDIDDMIGHLPFSCELVGVELSDRSVPLTRFAHPDRALYLLGAEDYGLPDDILARCHRVVQIPSPVDWSLNVSVAGSMVLHDRFVKAGAGV
ncbi:RNA methyltransferase [Mycobacteroides chelonae]|uniref:RNA methyltransferase n=1 Tax=Mycobacteroides chelonae TaxID=1774 RepID=UPI0022772CBD|nr:RNA methyltransferase [Mycobacteroides chelonae]